MISEPKRLFEDGGELGQAIGAARRKLATRENLRSVARGLTNAGIVLSDAPSPRLSGAPAHGVAGAKWLALGVVGAAAVAAFVLFGGGSSRQSDAFRAAARAGASPVPSVRRRDPGVVSPTASVRNDSPRAGAAPADPLELGEPVEPAESGKPRASEKRIDPEPFGTRASGEAAPGSAMAQRAVAPLAGNEIRAPQARPQRARVDPGGDARARRTGSTAFPEQRLRTGTRISDHRRARPPRPGRGSQAA